MSGNESRLPKWAQDELRLLRMRLAEQTERAELAEKAAGVVADRMYGIHPANPTETVHFGGVDVPSREGFSVRLDRHDRTVLHVHAGSAVAVLPEASNSIVVRLRGPL